MKYFIQILLFMYFTYTFSSKRYNSIRVLISLLCPFQLMKSRHFKHSTLILIPSCKVWIKCFIYQSTLQSFQSPYSFSEWKKCSNNPSCICSSPCCAFLSLPLYLFDLNQNLPVVEPTYCSHLVSQLYK